MSIHVNPHKVTLQAHPRNGDYSLRGLSVSDLTLLHQAILMMRDVGSTNPGDEWWQDVKTWASQFGAALHDTMVRHDVGRPVTTEFEVPWVDR